MENSEILNINEIFMESLFDDEIQHEILMESIIEAPDKEFESAIQNLRDSVQSINNQGSISKTLRRSSPDFQWDTSRTPFMQQMDHQRAQAKASLEKQIEAGKIKANLKLLLGTSKNVGGGITAYVIAVKLAEKIGLEVGSLFDVIKNFKVFASINPLAYSRNKKYVMIIILCALLTIYNAIKAGGNLIKFIKTRAAINKTINENKDLLENGIDRLVTDYSHRIQTTSDQSSLRRLGSSIMNDNILSVRHKRILTGEIAKKLGTPRLESGESITYNTIPAQKIANSIFPHRKIANTIQSILNSIGLGSKLRAPEVVISFTDDNKAVIKYSGAIESLNRAMKFNGAVGVFNTGAATLAYITACRLAKNAGLPVGSYRNVLTNFKVFLSINPFKSENPIMVKIWIGAMLSILNALVGGKNIQIAISAYLTKKKLVAEYQTESLSFTKQLEAIDLMESYSPRRAVLSMRMFDDLIKRKGISSKTKSSFSELVNYVQDRNEFKQDSNLSQTIRKEYGESFDDYKARYNTLFSKV